MNNEDLEQSLSIFDKLSQLYPSDESYFYNKGNIHMRMENWEEAVKEFTIAIRLNPVLVDAYIARGKAYVQLGKTSEAKKDFEQSLQLKEDIPGVKEMLTDYKKREQILLPFFFTNLLL